MNNYFKRPIKNALLAMSVAAALSSMPAYAAFNGAILSELQIKPSSTNAYQIVLNTNKKASFKKFITADNKIVIDLKNTKPAKFVNTVYNNASNIEHVIVQPISDDKIRIFLQGKNVSDSKIILNTNTAAVTIPSFDVLPNIESASSEITPEDVIVLGKPVEAFKPVIDYEEDLADFETLENTNAKTIEQSMLAGFSLKDSLNSNNLGWIVSFVMMLLFGIFGFKFLKPKKQTFTIGSMESLKERDLALYKNLKNKTQLGGIGLGAKTARQYPKVNPAVSNYALKEYQSGQMPRRNINATKIPKPQDTLIRPQQPQNYNKALAAKGQQTLKTKRPASAVKVNQVNMNKANSNLDNIKFLESMAKIYENSGRMDLAKELHNNIRKAKMAS